ncbi:MAG: 3'-5' exonuclease [Candidatus Aminicenantes bacterium]|jgi:superfamily I DNA/RNA helicase
MITCLVARTNQLLEQYKKALEEKGIEVYRIKRSEAEDRNKTGLRITTMHRVKGLEFDHIILAGLNDGVVPIKRKNMLSADPLIQKEHEQIERSLLYVSTTRARQRVLITCSGPPSGFIRKMKENKKNGPHKEKNDRNR